MPTVESLSNSHWIRSALAASRLMSSLLIRFHRAIVSLMVAVLVLTATPSIYAIGPAYNGSPADGAIPAPSKTESSLIIIWSAQWGNHDPHFFVAVLTPMAVAALYLSIDIAPPAPSAFQAKPATGASALIE